MLRFELMLSLCCSQSPPLRASKSKGKDRVENTQVPKINSFEAALAKKGIVMKKMSEPSSPSKQQYLADFNGYRVP
jgi:hypothetical protein